MTRDTTPTDRRGYERPEQGDQWAGAWDALVEDLDANSLYDEAGEIATANISDDAVSAAKLAAAAVGTGELSDEAVTAAKIAAAAVDSGAIADGAVGVDELAAALGTSSDSPISGTVHLQDTVHDSVSTEEIQNSDYNESVEVHAGVSGTVTLDLSLANVHHVEATDNVTLEFSNVTAGVGNSLLVYLTDDGTGPHTISWPASVVWSDGEAVNDIPAGGDVEVGLLSGDGSEWRGRESGRAFE